MKKQFCLIITLALCVGLFAGCAKADTTKSLTYSVETGDNIKVEVDTKAGYDITTDIPFIINKDGNEVLVGMFALSEYFDIYHEGVEADEVAKLLEEGENDWGEYFLYWVGDDEGTEHNFIVKIKGSETVLIASAVNSDEETAKAAFNAITATKVS